MTLSRGITGAAIVRRVRPHQLHQLKSSDTLEM